MSEHWKSTPKYWCKHCSLYVRDTKLERANHEATPKHQGRLKRALNQLHQNHDREEREKQRVQAEVDRLKGITSGTRPPPPVAAPTTTQETAEDRKRQMEQLAALGVSIPTDYRGEMAMPGEWTVTSTKVVDDSATDSVEFRAVGVRKREETDEQREEEEAMRGLKRQKRWGRKGRILGDGEEDAELDALLAGDFVKSEKTEADADKVKREDTNEVKKESADEIKKEPNADEIKKEDDAGDAKKEIDTEIKREPGEEAPMPAPPEGESTAAAPVFKKRKPKNIRQR